MKTFIPTSFLTSIALGIAFVSGSAGAQPAPAAAPGFDGKTVNVGYIGPLTGPVAVLGLPVLTGLELWFEQVNAKGGLAGKYKVKLVTEDNQAVEPLSVQRYARIKGEVSVASMFGTSTTKAVLPELRRDKFVLSPVGFEGFMIHDPNLLPIGSTYELMAINSVDYLLKQGGKQDANYCALIRDDPYGHAGLKGWKFALESNGKKVLQTGFFAAADRDFTGQINQFKAAKCDVVLVTTVPGQLVAIASGSARAGFAPTWVGQWPSWHSALLTTPVVDYLEKNLLVAGEGVEWGSDRAPGMKQLVDQLSKSKADQKPDMWIVVGYNQGRAITALLEKAIASGDLSRDGVLKALSQLDAVDNAGLGGNYKYGAIASRAPAMAGSIFKVNRNKPFGLEGVMVNHTAPMTGKFVFEAEAGTPSK